MTITTDYHMHSQFSPDGHDSPEALCWRARALGYDAIAITDHMEWQGDWVGRFDAAGYLDEMAGVRQKFSERGLQVLTGVEMGNPHDHLREANLFLDDHPFDVWIASQHWLYGQNIHLSSCFAGRDPQEVYADYFRELGRMVNDFGRIDVLAHFDRILWRGTLLGAPFNAHLLEGVIRDVLATIASRGIALELNTRLLDQSPDWRQSLTTMLTWYRMEGGRQIVVNSDAHRIDQVGSNAHLVTRILTEAGLTPTRLQIRADAR